MENKFAVADLVITEFSKKIGLIIKYHNDFLSVNRKIGGIYCEVLIEKKIMLIPMKNLTKI